MSTIIKKLQEEFIVESFKLSTNLVNSKVNVKSGEKYYKVFSKTERSNISNRNVYLCLLRYVDKQFSIRQVDGSFVDINKKKISEEIMNYVSKLDFNSDYDEPDFVYGLTEDYILRDFMESLGMTKAKCSVDYKWVCSGCELTVPSFCAYTNFGKDSTKPMISINRDGNVYYVEIPIENPISDGNYGMIYTVDYRKVKQIIIDTLYPYFLCDSLTYNKLLSNYSYSAITPDLGIMTNTLSSFKPIEGVQCKENLIAMLEETLAKLKQ